MGRAERHESVQGTRSRWISGQFAIKSSALRKKEPRYSLKNSIHFWIRGNMFLLIPSEDCSAVDRRYIAGSSYKVKRNRSVVEEEICQDFTWWRNFVTTAATYVYFSIRRFLAKYLLLASDRLPSGKQELKWLVSDWLGAQRTPAADPFFGFSTVKHAFYLHGRPDTVNFCVCTTRLRWQIIVISMRENQYLAAADVCTYARSRST